MPGAASTQTFFFAPDFGTDNHALYLPFRSNRGTLLGLDVRITGDPGDAVLVMLSDTVDSQMTPLVGKIIGYDPAEGFASQSWWWGDRGIRIPNGLVLSVGLNGGVFEATGGNTANWVLPAGCMVSGLVYTADD